MTLKYYSIEAMIDMIVGSNGLACARILADNRKLFQTVQGSISNHQAWPGGYFDHVQEVMNIAIALYEKLSTIRPLPFSLSDLLIVVYLHDAEKPWKYELGEDGELRHIASMQTKEDHQRFRMKKLAEYGVELSSEQENGIQFAEGEIIGHSKHHRAMGPLACVAHMCDVASARLWFDHPMEDDDPWTGAGRFRD